MRETIKTLFFDIGNVLLHLHPERTLRYLQRFTALPENILKEAFAEKTYHAYEVGNLGEDDFFKSYKSNLPQPNSLIKKDFLHAWLKLLGSPTETMELARNLARTYPVWLASNTNPCHIHYCENQGYFKKFTGAVYSFEIGVRKPTNEFFHKALKMADASALSTLFVDDRLENVQAALELGFVTIHYQSHDQFKQELNKNNIKEIG